MKDLKKYRIAIIGGISALAYMLISKNLTSNTQALVDPYAPTVILLSLIIGAIVAFAIDKVWK